MMTMIKEAIRKYVPLSAADEEIVDRLFSQKEYKKGDYLLRAGTTCRHVFFIETGLVRYYITSDGEERTNYFSREGEFVCDYLSFMPQQPGDVSIQALEDTLVWMIGFDDMQRFYREVSTGERFGRLAIEVVFCQAIGQIASLYRDPPEVRYERFMESFPDLVKRIPQYYIASYVGVKPQSLSRIRKRIAGH